MYSQEYLPGPLLTKALAASLNQGSSSYCSGFRGNLPCALLSLASEAPSHSTLAVTICLFIMCCKPVLCLIYFCVSHLRVMHCSFEIHVIWLNEGACKQRSTSHGKPQYNCEE